MRNFLFLLCCSVALFTFGCGDDDACTNGDGEISLDEYIAQENLMVETDASGLRYVILEPGSGDMPELDDMVEVEYRGFFTNEVVFDQTTGSTREFRLGGLIESWRIGIPLIGRGGRILLLSPADLAYGNNPPPGICPGSEMVFEVTLVDF